MSNTDNYVYLAMTANGWGSGKTESKAVDACKRAMGSQHVKDYGYILYNVHPGFNIDEVDGTIYTPKGHPPIEIKKKARAARQSQGKPMTGKTKARYKLTRAKLLRFIKRRRESYFASNLQFQIDANACGFEVAELGDPQKFTIDGFTGYEWRPFVDVKGGIGEQVRLVEFGGSIMLYLEGETDEDTVRMFELMKTAKYIQPEPEPAT